MSNPFPANSPAASPPDPEEVLNLFCPICNTGLNIRRKHVGVEGKCVQCKTAVTAKDAGGKIALVAANAPMTQAMPEAPTEAEPVQEARAQTPGIPTPPYESPAPNAETPAPASPQLSNPPQPEPEEPAAASAFSSPEAPPASPWGFPGRDQESEESPSPPAHSMPALQPEQDVSKPSGLEASAPSEFATFEDKASTPEALPESENEDASPIDSSTGNSSSLFDSPPIPDRNLQPASADNQPNKAPEETPGTQAAFNDPAASESESKSSTMEDSSFFLEKDVPMPNAGSALFGGQNTAAESDDEISGEINTSWGAKVPSSGHASISPFNDNDSSAGFAESLFREKAVEQSITEEIEPKSPFAEPTDPALGGGALFSSPAAPSAPKTEPEEEVVLDGDGRPMKPMSDEEKDHFAKEMMQVGEYHKRSPWLVKIVKFLITLCVLGGLGYAGYIFMPDEKVKEWKQKTLDWLEPGSVLLDFLPVEIVENENGEKEMKVKAVESLNEFSSEMDAYLDASDQNLRESGADVPEREKTEKMEGPKIPKLPFELPNVNRSGEDSEETPKE